MDYVQQINLCHLNNLNDVEMNQSIQKLMQRTMQQNLLLEETDMSSDVGLFHI